MLWVKERERQRIKMGIVSVNLCEITLPAVNVYDSSAKHKRIHFKVAFLHFCPVTVIEIIIAEGVIKCWVYIQRLCGRTVCPCHFGIFAVRYPFVRADDTLNIMWFRGNIIGWRCVNFFLGFRIGTGIAQCITNTKQFGILIGGTVVINKQTNPLIKRSVICNTDGIILRMLGVIVNICQWARQHKFYWPSDYVSSSIGIILRVTNGSPEVVIRIRRTDGRIGLIRNPNMIPVKGTKRFFTDFCYSFGNHAMKISCMTLTHYQRSIVKSSFFDFG